MRKLLIGVAAAGALAITTGTALAFSAQDDSGQPTTLTTSPTTSSSTPTSPSSTSTSSSTSAPAPGEEKLSAEDASKIVQAKLGGGQVHEIEREFEHGRIEWKVEITAPDGKTYDVRIDAETGQITRTDLDSDSDDHKGKDDD